MGKNIAKSLLDQELLEARTFQPSSPNPGTHLPFVTNEYMGRQVGEHTVRGVGLHSQTAVRSLR